MLGYEHVQFFTNHRFHSIHIVTGLNTIFLDSCFIAFCQRGRVEDCMCVSAVLMHL